MAIITVIEDGVPKRVDTDKDPGFVEDFLNRLKEDYVYRSLLNAYLRGTESLTQE